MSWATPCAAIGCRRERPLDARRLVMLPDAFMAELGIEIVTTYGYPERINRVLKMAPAVEELKKESA